MSEETEIEALEQHIEADQVEEVTENTEQEVQASEETEKPKQSRSQNAKQRLRRKLAEEQAKTEAYEERIRALEQKVEVVVNPPAARPDRVNFETEEDYEDALYEWRQPKTVEQAAPARPEQTQPQAQAPVIPSNIRENWESQLDKAEDKYSDFDDVVMNNPDLSTTDIMAQAIMGADQGGEVAYYLGSNPDEAYRIANLSIIEQIREIDGLNNKFKPSQSSAPAPIEPTKGVDTPITDLDKLSPDEYRQRRREQRAQRR